MKVIGGILAGIFAIYFISTLVVAPYYNWEYAKEHGFVSWLTFGQIVPTAKAFIWPYFVFIQEKEVGDGERFVERGGLTFKANSETPYTGTRRGYWSNGQKQFDSEYRDGKLVGKVTQWYENGKKQVEGEYRDGKPHGKIIAWHKSGQKLSETEWRDGQKNGKLTTWYESGKKYEEGEYHDGKPHGKITIWYENGQKKGEGEHRDGELHGKWIYWYENGQKGAEIELRDDKLIRKKCWDENGNSIDCADALNADLLKF